MSDETALELHIILQKRFVLHLHSEVAMIPRPWLFMCGERNFTDYTFLEGN
jgi:hypothetical protein